MATYRDNLLTYLIIELGKKNYWEKKYVSRLSRKTTYCINNNEYMFTEILIWPY